MEIQDKFRPLALLVTSAWALKGGFCACVICTKNTVYQNIMCYCMHGSRKFCLGWGSRPDCQKTAHITLFCFSPQLILQFCRGDSKGYQWFISKKTIVFQRFRGSPTFSRQGGSNFFQGVGGGPNANFYRNP